MLHLRTLLGYRIHVAVLDSLLLQTEKYVREGADGRCLPEKVRGIIENRALLRPGDLVSQLDSKYANLIKRHNALAILKDFCKNMDVQEDVVLTNLTFI